MMRVPKMLSIGTMTTMFLFLIHCFPHQRLPVASLPPLPLASFLLPFPLPSSACLLLSAMDDGSEKEAVTPAFFLSKRVYAFAAAGDPKTLFELYKLDDIAEDRTNEIVSKTGATTNVRIAAVFDSVIQFQHIRTRKMRLQSRYDLTMWIDVRELFGNDVETGRNLVVKQANGQYLSLLDDEQWLPQACRVVRSPVEELCRMCVILGHVIVCFQCGVEREYSQIVVSVLDANTLQFMNTSVQPHSKATQPVRQFCWSQEMCRFLTEAVGFWVPPTCIKLSGCGTHLFDMQTFSWLGSVRSNRTGSVRDVSNQAYRLGILTPISDFPFGQEVAYERVGPYHEAAYTGWLQKYFEAPIYVDGVPQKIILNPKTLWVPSIRPVLNTTVELKWTCSSNIQNFHPCQSYLWPTIQHALVPCHQLVILCSVPVGSSRSVEGHDCAVMSDDAKVLLIFKINVSNYTNASQLQKLPLKACMPPSEVADSGDRKDSGEASQPVKRSDHSGEASQPVERSKHSGEASQQVECSKHSGEASQPIERSAGDSSQPVERSAGDSSQPVERSAGDSSQPVKRSKHSGEASQPVERSKHSGEASQQVKRSKHSGEVSQPIERSKHSGEASQSVERSAGDSSQPVERSAGDSSQPVERSAGDSSQPVKRSKHSGEASQPVERSKHSGEASQPVKRSKHSGEASQPVKRSKHSGEASQPVKRLVPLCEQVVGISIDETRTHVRPGTSPTLIRVMYNALDICVGRLSLSFAGWAGWSESIQTRAVASEPVRGESAPTARHYGRATRHGELG